MSVHPIPNREAIAMARHWRAVAVLAWRKGRSLPIGSIQRRSWLAYCRSSVKNYRLWCEKV